MKAGKIVAAVFAMIFALVAVGLLVGGSALVWAHTTQRDADGFLSHGQHIPGGRTEGLRRHHDRWQVEDSKVITE